MKCQKFEALLQQKELQIVSCLEVADRACQHLLKIQQEDKLFKLERFANEEFEANLAVIRHIRMERLQEENERDFNGGGYHPGGQLDNDRTNALHSLNAISEDASILSSQSKWKSQKSATERKRSTQQNGNGGGGP